MSLAMKINGAEKWIAAGLGFEGAVVILGGGGGGMILNGLAPYIMLLD